MAQNPPSGTGTTLLVLLRDPTSPEAWEAFVHRYGPRILRWCQLWCAQQADAEDVTQEVLYKLARRIRSLPYDPSQGSFRAWLETLTHNAWIDIRDRRRPSTELPKDQQDPHPGLEEVLDQEFMLEVYEEAKRRVQTTVNPQTWRGFELLVIESWPSARVASELNVGISAVYTAKSRVKAELEREVARLLAEPDSERGWSEP